MISFRKSHTSATPRIDCQLEHVILQHKSPSMFMAVRRIRIHCREVAHIRRWSRMCDPPCPYAVLPRDLVCHRANLDCWAGIQCMIYDRHSWATRGVALLSACLTKGRKLLPILILIRCLRPISLPRDRSRAFPITSPFQARGSSFIYASSCCRPWLARRPLFSRSQCGLHHLL